MYHVRGYHKPVNDIHTNKIYPVKRDRIKTLLFNMIKHVDTESLSKFTLDEKLYFFKEEIGFTDEEIEALDLKNYLKNC